MSAPTLTPEEVHKIAAVEASHWWYVGTREIFFALLQPYLHALPPQGGSHRMRILDVGCGTGGNLAALERLGDARGIDIDALCVDYCRQRGLRADLVSMSSLGVAPGSLDLVTLFDVVTQADRGELPRTLEGIHDALAPGGLVALREPAMAVAAGAHDPGAGVRYRLSRGEVRDALLAAGLEPLRITYHNTLLFPLIVAQRRLQRWLRPGHVESDVKPTAAPVNALLLWILRVEKRMLKAMDLPFGVSVFAVARKPAEARR
jgi:SAM-dependent methyltransferase